MKYLYDRECSLAALAVKWVCELCSSTDKVRSDLIYGQVRRTHLFMGVGCISFDSPWRAAECWEDHVGLDQDFLEPLHH